MDPETCVHVLCTDALFVPHTAAERLQVRSGVRDTTLSAVWLFFNYTSGVNGIAVEKGGGISVRVAQWCARMAVRFCGNTPTSQNRDVGHPLQWRRHEMWATRRGLGHSLVLRRLLDVIDDEDVDGAGLSHQVKPGLGLERLDKGWRGRFGLGLRIGRTAGLGRG